MYGYFNLLILPLTLNFLQTAPLHGHATSVGNFLCLVPPM